MQIAIAKLDIDKDELLEVSQENEVVSVVSQCPPSEGWVQNCTCGAVLDCLQGRFQWPDLQLFKGCNYQEFCLARKFLDIMSSDALSFDAKVDAP